MNCEFENGSVTYEKTRFGAPPLPVTYLPSTTIEPVAWIWPSTLSTPSAVFAMAITDSGSGPATVPLSDVNAVFLESTTSMPLLLSWKMSENALLIWSRRMNVPVIIAVPRTIESAVSTVRSLRPHRPRSATCITAR